MFAARHKDSVEPNTCQHSTGVLEKLSDKQGMGGIGLRAVIDAVERLRETQGDPGNAAFV